MNRVTKKNPCPICQHPDWCLIAPDGSAAICQRVKSNKPAGDAGWLHKLNGEQTKAVKYQVSQPDPPKPKVDIFPIFKQHRANLAPELRHKLAEQLGVSDCSLMRLEAGYDGRNYTFPMRNGHDRVVGISVRGDGKKWCVPGSNNGLFWPAGLDLEGDSPLWICEGASDCAALLDLGFDAIGRQGCSGCTSDIVLLLEKLHQKKAIIITADKDAPKIARDGRQWTPGLEGAMRLATILKPIAASVKVIMPPRSKDIRQWTNEGATKEAVLAVLKNTRFACIPQVAMTIMQAIKEIT